MSARRLTRRSLLAAAAGTAAGGLLRPTGVLAALAGPAAPRLGEHWLGRLAGDGAHVTIALSRIADLVGVEWQGPAHAHIELRFRTASGSWSHWACAGARGHGPETPAAGARTIGEPVWTGGTTVVQLRARQPLTGLRLHTIDASGGVGASRQARSLEPLAWAAALPLAAPVLDAGSGQPPIIARRAWAQGISPPKVAPAYGAVRLAFVHHTENPNGYSAGEVPAMLRAIYAFHRYVNDWNDIGYNFVVDLYGRIFEARAGGVDESVVGAHAGGYNLVSTGVAVLGSFMSAPISAPARQALEALLAWKLSLHGVPSQGELVVRVNPAGASYSRFPANAHVPLPRIAGHRDGDSTDCPGDVLYGELPGIRAGVLARAPSPTRATLALIPASAPSPASTPAQPQTGEQPATTALVGTLQRLDGTPIAGAPVLLQARTVSRKGEVVLESTIAQVTTDAQGQWSLPGASAPAAATPTPAMPQPAPTASSPAPAGSSPAPTASSPAPAAPVPGPHGKMWLRALFAGSGEAGAAISEQLHAAFTPASAPASTGQPEAPAPMPPAAAPPAA